MRLLTKVGQIISMDLSAFTYKVWNFEVQCPEDQIHTNKYKKNPLYNIKTQMTKTLKFAWKHFHVVVIQVCLNHDPQG